MSDISKYDRAFFGHPRGLSTLFFTEMWERFSYYGMRALLILFMTATAANGGLGFDVMKAGAIYGLYTSMVYMTGLPGGWIADRFLGQRRAVLLGGIIIALGSFCLAIHDVTTFYFGLAFIVAGSGLLKPNVSSMVGNLYSEQDRRRDAGFSIFYMGINLGATIAPLICGYIGQKIDWHWGFGAAGVGMTFGVIQYALGGKYLGDIGLQATKKHDSAQSTDGGRRMKLTVFIVLGFVLAGAIIWVSGILDTPLKNIITVLGFSFLALLVVGYFTWIFVTGSWNSVERKRIAVIAILFLFTSMFWAAFEQAGSTLNLFADRFTQNSAFGLPFPSSWFQSVNSVFIIAFAPVFAWLWIKLGKHEPSSPGKFSLGLIFVGLGYLLLVPAAMIVISSGGKVSPMWLVGVYLLHTFGELSLSPVGLSMVTKLAPARILGQMMGIWFLSISLGNFIGGQVAGLFESLPLPILFASVFGTTAGAGIILFFLKNPIRKLMGGVN
jgi:POT family proton-dependent oligopeptide transporter